MFINVFYFNFISYNMLSSTNINNTRQYHLQQYCVQSYCNGLLIWLKLGFYLCFDFCPLSNYKLKVKKGILNRLDLNMLIRFVYIHLTDILYVYNVLQKHYWNIVYIFHWHSINVTNYLLKG